MGKTNEQKILDLLNDANDYVPIFTLRKMSGVKHVHSALFNLKKRGYVIDAKVMDGREKKYKLVTNKENVIMKKKGRGHNGNGEKVLNCMLNSDWMTVNDIRLRSEVSNNNSIHSAIANLRKKGYNIESKPSGEFVNICGNVIETKMYRIAGLPEVTEKKVKKTESSYAWNFNTLSEVPASVIVAGRKCRISLSFEE